MRFLDETGLQALIDGLRQRVVRKVAGKTPNDAGSVSLTAGDVGARPDSWVPEWTQVRNRPAVSAGSGRNALCLGNGNAASAAESVAAGRGTVTAKEGQLAAGTYNSPDEDAVLCLGNGTGEEQRSNCAVVLGSGEAWFAGGVKVGESREVLATRRDLEEAFSSLVNGDEVEY